MKTFAAAPFLAFLFIFISQSTSAQSNRLVVRQDCFTANKIKGDDYRVLRKFDLAVQQYQAAKYCKGISRIQNNQIDSLINVTRKQQQTNQKVLIRKY